MILAEVRSEVSGLMSDTRETVVTSEQVGSSDSVSEGAVAVDVHNGQNVAEDDQNQTAAFVDHTSEIAKLPGNYSGQILAVHNQSCVLAFLGMENVHFQSGCIEFEGKLVMLEKWGEIF